MAYSKTNWQNLPSTTTPVVASNLNKIEDELELLDQTNDYSTTEKVIGKWKDGKDLYGIVYETNQLSNTYFVPIANVSEIVDVDGRFQRKDYSNVFHKIPSRLTDNSGYLLEFGNWTRTDATQIGIQIITGSAWTSTTFNKAIFIIKYTKETN